MTLFDQEKRGSTKGNLNTFVFFFLWVGLPIIGLLLLIFPWVATALLLILGFICEAFLLIVIPISLVLLFFKNTRRLGGVGLQLSSYVLGATTWLWCLVLARALAGLFFTILGLLLVGIGIVPIAFLAALISGEWLVALQIALSVSGVYILRGSGNYFLVTPEERTLEKEFARFIDEERTLEKEFARFIDESDFYFQALWKFKLNFEKKRPLIEDDSLLPCTKENLFDILDKLESDIGRLKKMNIYCNQSRTKKEILDQCFEAVSFAQVYAKGFARIEIEDKERVDYFNSYSTIDDIPEEEIYEYCDLSSKYRYQ